MKWENVNDAIPEDYTRVFIRCIKINDSNKYSYYLGMGYYDPIEVEWHAYGFYGFPKLCMETYKVTHFVTPEEVDIDNEMA